METPSLGKIPTNFVAQLNSVGELKLPIGTRTPLLSIKLLPDVTRLKAVILDVDGTLYGQARVRRAMFRKLLQHHLTCPLQGISTIRILRSYRRAQETLRRSPQTDSQTVGDQLRLTSEWTGMAPEIVNAYVTRWMEQEPLPFLPLAIYSGLIGFLQDAKNSGIRLAALSDYDPTRKIHALGLERFFEVIASAQDADIQVFKPHPRGLEVVMKRLAVAKDEVLYIGDRPEVDGVAADAAGISCVIVGRKASRQKQWMGISGYKELANVFRQC